MFEDGGGCGSLCEGQPEKKVSFASEGALLKVNKTIRAAKKNQQIITRSWSVCNSHIGIIYARIILCSRSVNEGIQTISVWSGAARMSES